MIADILLNMSMPSYMASTNSVLVPSALPQFGQDWLKSKLETYPVANSKYTKIDNTHDAITYAIRIKTYYPHLFQEAGTIKAAIKNEHLFVGNLREVRIHRQSPDLDLEEVPDYTLDGHVYDPWFRDISELNLRFVPKFHHRFTAKIGNSFTNQLVVWVYDTTLDGLDVSILIYDYIDVYYANTPKTNKFYTSISPYSVKTDTQYKLVV